MRSKIFIEFGDITTFKVDAIVNAANKSLLGGGGVDGAIHRAAGPLLLEECRALKGCETGAAKITSGYRLPAKQIIHTVGPVWRGGNYNEDDLLANCYLSSLALAAMYNVKTIAFPSISTGAYGFPVDRAAKIALTTIVDFLKMSNVIEKIILVTYSKKDYEVYLNTLNELFPI